MERLYTTVVQLEESKRLIQDGDTAHLRLALILLDNAVEVMMHRIIEKEISYSDMYDRMLQNSPADPSGDPKLEEIRQEMLTNVIPRKRQRELKRIFGEKAKFLSEDRDEIPLACARALKHLHDYRNEIQHRDQVRPDSIKAATLIFFDIATDLLVRLEPGTTVWSSENNYEWLKRYGIAQGFGVSSEIRPRIAEGLRDGLPLGIAGIRTALVVHLIERVEVMEEQLLFISENLSNDYQQETALKFVQFCRDNPGYRANFNAELRSYAAPHGPDAFRRWRAAAEELNTVEDKLEMFDRFATIEDEFEPLETMIDDMVSEIDSYIQHQIDVMRGK